MKFSFDLFKSSEGHLLELLSEDWYSVCGYIDLVSSIECTEFSIAFWGDGLAQRKAYINGKIIACSI